MGLKYMLSLCKKSKCIGIKYFGKQKFLTDGHAGLCMDICAPDWTAEDCAIAIELDEETKDKFQIHHSLPTECDNAIDIEDFEGAKRLIYSLNISGVPSQPFILDNGCIFFVDLGLLRTFSDENNKEYYYGRLPGDKQTPALLVAVNDCIIGFVTVELIDAEIMKNFASQLLAGSQRAEEKRFNIYGGQVSMDDM